MDYKQVVDLSADDAPMGFNNIRIVFHMPATRLPVFHPGYQPDGEYCLSVQD
jgi:chitinase